jgi:hypothetical protein
MKQHAWKHQQHARLWLHHQLVGKNNRRAVFLSLQINHGRKIGRKVAMRNGVVGLLVNGAPTVRYP